jgi:hypothetical protein
MNLWVCTIGGGIWDMLVSWSASATDGVAMTLNILAILELLFPYNLGRTAAEVGHWMNLRHIWEMLIVGDLVSDTPTHNTSNYGVPAYPHYSGTCKSSRNDNELHGFY